MQSSQTHTSGQTLVVACFAVSFVAVLVSWIYTGNDARGGLQVPLLLLGVSSILMLLLTCQTSASLFVAVFILGTVVAQENFLVKIAAIVRGRTASDLQAFLNTPPVDPRQTAEKTAQTVIDTLRPSLPEGAGAAMERPEVKLKLTTALENDQVERIARRVSDQGASVLKILSTDARPFPFSKVQSEDRLNGAKVGVLLTQLASEGLLQCTTPGRLDSCGVTLLGKSVLAAYEQLRGSPSPDVVVER